MTISDPEGVRCINKTTLYKFRFVCIYTYIYKELRVYNMYFYGLRCHDPE